LAFAAALSVSLAAAATGAEAVGRASAVRPDARQTPEGAAAAGLRVNEPIWRNATLDTSGAGALEVVFADQSKLSLGPDSNAVVDEFTYAGPGQSAGGQALRYGKGVFRFISGAVPPERVRLETPAVTIGIRGTEVRNYVLPDGGTWTAALLHRVWVRIKASGQTIELAQGQRVYVGPDGVPGPVEDTTSLPCDE
jgi:hypothetical protein